MPRGSGDALPPHLARLVASLPPEALRELLDQAMATASGRAVELAAAPAVSRVQRPLEHPVVLRVRVDLVGARPPIWRRLDLAGEMTLDVLHRVLQVAMGWTDSHLHGFSAGGDRYDRSAERYLTEFDLSEGDTGTAEAGVRLDQVLREPGDVLHYEYDFGDGWTHRIVLEEVRAPGDGTPAARCVTGRRACPPEDVGGIGSYEDLLAARAADDPDEHVRERLEWLGEFDPEAFSVDDVNRRLPVALVGFAVTADLPAPLAAMLSGAGQGGRPLLEELVVRARLDEPAEVAAGTAESMVAPYAWFVRRLGADGVRLTQAGYLPPRVVEDVVEHLALGREWIGAGNRESHTFPVLAFRESAQSLGLVTKRRGVLTATAAARRLADDPVGLWEHVATRLPIGRDEASRQAATVMLLDLAADEPVGWPREELIATVLSSLGWTSGGRRISPGQVLDLLEPTWTVLVRTGAVGDRRLTASEPSVTPGGRMLARRALRSL
ncbi:plasmid pRiA4b ORF-3 family protein [Thalassiella azotivora]